MRLTSKLLLPVARDLTSLRLHCLLALGASASALAGAQSAVSTGGDTHAPLPFSTVRFFHLFLCKEGHESNHHAEMSQTPQHPDCEVYVFYLYLHCPGRQWEYDRCLLNDQINAWFREEMKKTWGWGQD